jgi:hypothetical protein
MTQPDNTSSAELLAVPSIQIYSSLSYSSTALNLVIQDEPFAMIQITSNEWKLLILTTKILWGLHKGYSKSDAENFGTDMSCSLVEEGSIASVTSGDVFVTAVPGKPKDTLYGFPSLRSIRIAH